MDGDPIRGHAAERGERDAKRVTLGEGAFAASEGVVKIANAKLI